MISIRIPDNLVAERTYVIDVIFSEFLGLDYKIAIGNGTKDYEITLENGKTLLVRDHFFRKFEEASEYLTQTGIPSNALMCTNKFSPDADIPVIFGTGELAAGQDSIICGADIFASSFFMLTRWEEYANRGRDSHDRFPAHESLAQRSGFLHRAVVNEYVEMLWNMLNHLKCGQHRKERNFRTFATHDVDNPFLYAARSPFIALKQMCGDIIRRKDPAAAFGNFRAWAKTANGREDLDPFNTFDWMMDVSEGLGLKSHFLFITGHSEPARDGGYDCGHKLLRSLMQNIHRRGHHIGLHLSYGSFDSPEQTKKEFDILKTACSGLGVRQESWMSRQHFLRWKTPETFENLESACLDYDSTLSYADAAGFRCGVCYEYPAFDVLARKRLRLRERPLLVMDCTVIDRPYMNLGAGEQAYSTIKNIKDTCRRYGGDFVVLWHNTRLIDQAERGLYNQILRA